MKKNYMKKVDFDYSYTSPVGLNKDIIKKISQIKKEPTWMTNFRVKALETFQNKKVPDWGPDLCDLNFDKLSYYLLPLNNKSDDWDKVPQEIKKTYEQLGIPQAERTFLSGVSAQFESEVVYENLAKKLKKKGIIFMDTDSALKKHPEIFKEYFSKIISPNDNKFSALNSAAWSGGTFIYVPKGVKVEMPIQAYFFINQENVGQFERTLIIADEGSSINYVEGCSAPKYTTSSLHSAVVEVFVKKRAKVRYTTVQNWSKNVYNLTTKRAIVEENGLMEWVDANIGSKVTMKYPACVLKEPKAKGKMLSISYAGRNQVQDSGGKMIHLAENTSSNIVSKSVVKDGGIASYRGLIKTKPGLKNVSSFVSCDSIIMDSKSKIRTYPHMNVRAKEPKIQHEASVEKIDQEKLFYLHTRGIKRAEAESMLVNGFIEPIIKKIPIEYAVEMNRLIELEMEGSIG